MSADRPAKGRRTTPAATAGAAGSAAAAQAAGSVAEGSTAGAVAAASVPASPSAPAASAGPSAPTASAGPASVPPGSASAPVATGSATPPDRVARAALARAQEAARSRGLRPGDKPRRTTVMTTGSGPDARDPQQVGVTASRLAAELGWHPGLVEGDLRGRWPELVGGDVAEHCAPEKFEAGLLTVRASSTAWAANLTLLAPQLLRRLDEELGKGVVVEVRVLGPAGPGFGKGRRSVPGRGARDTWG
jgi:predicted nucleic acid-binding Zn ribbon protein